MSISSCVTVDIGFVDIAFFRPQSRCPFAVAMDLGRNVLTFVAVNPGKVAKFPLLMARIHVVIVGLKHHARRN